MKGLWQGDLKALEIIAGVAVARGPVNNEAAMAELQCAEW